MKIRNLVFVMLVLVLAFPMLAMAQDTTPAPNPDIVLPVSTLFYGLIVAGLLSGAGFGVILTNFLHSKQNKDAAEKLFLATPPETQKFIRDTVVWLQGKVDDAFKFADDVTDGEENL